MLRQYCFDWLSGGPTRSGSRGRTLPVDAYWPGLGSAVEVYEREDDQLKTFCDKPGKLTVSGVRRGA